MNSKSPRSPKSSNVAEAQLTPHSKQTENLNPNLRRTSPYISPILKLIDVNLKKREMANNDIGTSNNNSAARNLNFDFNDEHAKASKVEQNDCSPPKVFNETINSESIPKWPKVMLEKLSSLSDEKPKVGETEVALETDCAATVKSEPIDELAESTDQPKTSEETFEETFEDRVASVPRSENNYPPNVDLQLADIVWGHVSRYPYWPAIICVEETTGVHNSGEFLVIDAMTIN